MRPDENTASTDLRPATVARAFGAENRARLLSRYFEQAERVTPENAWQHVYRLLLWIDRTTALAHCYESDKAQPGRSWYARSLTFHDWISGKLGVRPDELAESIDWLFREVVKDLANRAVNQRTEVYQQQREPYEGRGFPEPGDDPELAAIIRESLVAWTVEAPPEVEVRALIRRILAYLTQENMEALREHVRLGRPMSLQAWTGMLSGEP